MLHGIFVAIYIFDCFISVGRTVFLIVGYFVGMAFDVRLHLFLTFERFITNCALVAFRAVMLDAMQLQDVIVAEITKANVAMVRFLAGMRTGMHFELFRTGESFAAAFNRAFIWFLA